MLVSKTRLFFFRVKKIITLGHVGPFLMLRFLNAKLKWSDGFFFALLKMLVLQVQPHVCMTSFAFFVKKTKREKKCFDHN